MPALSANKIKFIRSLSQKKFRDEYSLFVVEGEKLVQEALNSSFKVREVYYQEEIGKECMARISNLSTPSPALAVVEKPQYSNEEVIKSFFSGPDKLQTPTSAPLCLALDGVKDPGNLGTIIRIADWFGIDAIFASEGSVEVYNPKVVQATMGAIFRKKVIYTDLQDLCLRVKASGLPVYGTFLDGTNMYKTTLQKCGLIVMGSESFGISDDLRGYIENRLYIPPYPVDSITSESLNVGVATAIICAEFRR